MRGITFERIDTGEKRHTYDDWGMLLRGRPLIEPPEPKFETVDLPGADGVVDLTQLTGDVKYSARDASISLIVVDARYKWNTVYSRVLNFLQGQKVKITLDDDPCFYYVGRLYVDKWASSKKTATLSISGMVEPYKLELYTSVNPALFDELIFDSDNMHRDYREISVESCTGVVIPNKRKQVVPSFLACYEGGVSVTKSIYVFKFENGARYGYTEIKQIPFEQWDEDDAEYTRNPYLVCDGKETHLFFQTDGTPAKVRILYQGGGL